MEISYSLATALGSMAILILIFPTYEHGISFHLFVSFSISFINISQFSVLRSFTSLVKFIPRYFILLDAIPDGIVSLISFFVCLLLVYRNATDFFILILHLEDLLDMFSSSNRILGGNLQESKLKFYFDVFQRTFIFIDFSVF